MATPLFDFGKVAISSKALEALETTPEDLVTLLIWHTTGEWRELDSFDRTVNEHAITEGGRIMTVHTLSNGQRLYICTEQTHGGALTTIVTDMH